MHSGDNLYSHAYEVLKTNDSGTYTRPAEGLYPHQWLWDSCFISIGLRHESLDRAMMELTSLVRGQWHNGMLPNIIFREGSEYRRHHNVWRSWLSPYAPDGVATSGITQPPMLAEAVVRIGTKMAWPERRLWYQTMYPSLLAYHEWLFHERDPHNEGLVLQIHPWEVGLDNTPPWMAELHEHLMPLWIRTIEKLRLEKVIDLFRSDTRRVPAEERTALSEALAMFDTQRRLRRKAYDINKILDHSLFTIEDLNFNCIFIRANEHLQEIAKSIKKELPEELEKHIARAKRSLEELWDPYSGQYYSRDFVTHRLIKTPSVATLLPLYAGCITQERADRLVHLLENEHLFGTAFPVPSVPPSSFWFRSKCYWQGPTWVNINWLIIDGLKRYGFKDYAAALRESTLEMVQKAGFSEYFDPITGEAAGAKNFSWTAALTMDLVKAKP